MFESSSTALIPYIPPMTPMEFIRLEAQKRASPSLPDEVMVRIFLLLDLRSLFRCSLVSRDWKRLSVDEFLGEEKPRSGSDLGKLKVLSSIFCKKRHFNCAIEAAEKYAKQIMFLGGEFFKDICKEACDAKDYEVARQCQLLAKKHSIKGSKVGKEAMSYIIKSQVADSDFLKNYEKLVGLSQALAIDDNKLGLEALTVIVEKLVELEIFDKAIECTQLIESLKNSRAYTPIGAINSYTQMDASGYGYAET